MHLFKLIKNITFKFSAFLLLFVAALQLPVSLHAQQTIEVSVPFDDGFIGLIGQNTQQANSIQRFSTLTISRAYFVQRTASGRFENQGNDIPGTLRLQLNNGSKVDLPGALVWRINSGNTNELLGFVANSSVSVNLNTYGGPNYTIQGGTANGNSNFGFKLNNSTYTLQATGGSESGNAANIDVALLNGYIDAIPRVIAPSPRNFNLSTANQDPGDFSLVRFPNGTLLCSIGLVNPPAGTTFNLSVTSGLTRSTGYTSWTGLTRISFTGTQTDINAALASMSVSTGSNAGNINISVSATVNTSGYNFNPVNGHYYRPISSSGITYANAKTAARASTFKGQAGYLATITSAIEQDFINSNTTATDIWFALSDANSEGRWYIDDGPEEGRVIWQTSASGITNSNTSTYGSSGSAQNGFYTNWDTGEPNNSFSTQGEDHAVTKWNGGTKWNDLNNGNTSGVQGYVIEYGTWTNPDDQAFTDFYIASTTYVANCSAGQTPVAPTVVSQGTRTGAGTVNLVVSVPAGTTADWYATETGGTVLSGGSGVTTFTTPVISANTNYYVETRNTSSGCLSTTRTLVTATILPCPTTLPNVQFKLSAPNVTNSAIEGQVGSRTETFNSMSTGVNLTTGNFAIGSYTKNNVGTLQVLPTSVWGGTGTNFLAIYLNSIVSINLTDPSRYVGFWWGAGDNANTVTIYGTCGGNEIQLAQFTTSTVINLLNQNTVTAVDGNQYNSSLYRRANAANEPFAYINLQLDNPDIYFTRLEFGGGGFEVDNITTSIGYGAATATTPSAPTITSVSVANGSASVNFTAPSSNGGSAITNYEYSTDGGTTWITLSPASTSSPVVIPGISNTNFSIKLRAVNSIGSGTASATYANTPPTITSLVNQTTSGVTPTTAQNFTVGDTETAAASLTVTATSSNTTLIPNSNIVLGGSGANRNVVVTAASGQTGTATITLTVNDGTGRTATSTFTVTVNDPNCSTFLPSDFRLNGNATVSNNIITLTTATNTQRGGAWNVNKIFLDKDFDISSRINLGTNDANGADGIAFVLQNQSINAGSSGGGLGYQGITPSFAVEFDTWYNGSFEPVQDHMAIIANGAAAGAHNTYATPYEVQMEDGQWHNVRFVWTANTKNFQAWYDGVKRFDITVDLKATIFNNAEYVFWGLTAATGGSVNLQQVEITNYCYTKQASITPQAGTNNNAASLNLCQGSDVVLEASLANTYQWFKNNVAIAGATQQTLRVAEAGSYKVETVTNGITTVSEASTVTVSSLPSISYAAATYSFIRNNTIINLSPVLGAGSPTPSSYSVSPALPTGLTLNTATGVISGRPTALAATADYVVTASTAAGCTSTYTLSLEVKNDAPPLNLVYNPNTQTVRQGTAITNMVPTVGGGAVITYTIAPSLPSGISINATTGVVSGTSTTAQTGSQVYTITATNSGGSATATITLIFNTAPTDITLSATSIAENNAANATVGTMSSTDADAGDTHTYTLVSGTGSTDNAAFNISGNSLRVNNVLDFETKSSYSIRVRTTDAGGLSFEKVFTVTVNNVNEAPSDIALSANTIAENNAANATVGTMSSTDADAGDTHTYTLVSGTGSTDNAAFNISGNSLRVSSALNFEAKSSYSIRVKTTDAGGLSFEKVFTVTVSNLNEAPTNINSTQLAIYENNAANATVSNLTSTDPDAGDTHTYTLVSGAGSTDNSSFSIVNNQLKAAVVFKFKDKESYSIRIRTTDAGGLTFEKTFTISIIESPVASGTGNLPGTNQITASSNDVTISKGYSSQLNVAGPGLVTYSWSPSIGLSATNVANPIASPSQTTVYTVTVTNAAGLTTVLYVTVNVVEDYNVTPTNIITPNGDGINDYWVIDNLDSYPDNEVQIFDKAGRILYQVKNYQNNWDGTINSNLLAEGTYYYVINFGSGKKIKKGYITIIRD